MKRLIQIITLSTILALTNPVFSESKEENKLIIPVPYPVIKIPNFNLFKENKTLKKCYSLNPYRGLSYKLIVDEEEILYDNGKKRSEKEIANKLFEELCINNIFFNSAFYFPRYLENYNSEYDCKIYLYIIFQLERLKRK